MSDPKPYVLPEGHLIQLGADVLDGWEGRLRTDRHWMDAKHIRSGYPEEAIFETRRIPEPTVAVHLPKSWVEGMAGGRSIDACDRTDFMDRCRKALEREATP